MQLLDRMFETGQLNRFVSEMIKVINEERDEKTLWEYWLHKDWERSWSEFRKALNDKPKAAPTQKETEEIVKESQSILASFRLPNSEVQNEHISDIRGNSDRHSEGEQEP